jgi:hypothetical protein
MALIFRKVDARESMPGILVGFKHHATVEQGAVAANSVFLRPPRIGVNLKSTAPFIAPPRVQIDDQIQAPVQLPRLVVIEIDVRVQLLAMQVFVRSAAKHLGIEN